MAHRRRVKLRANSAAAHGAIHSDAVLSLVLFLWIDHVTMHALCAMRTCHPHKHSQRKSA
jgi:hypothetical protein